MINRIENEIRKNIMGVKIEVGEIREFVTNLDCNIEEPRTFTGDIKDFLDDECLVFAIEDMNIILILDILEDIDDIEDVDDIVVNIINMIIEHN